MSRWTMVLAMVAALVWIAAGCYAGVQIGDNAPDWKGLIGVDGKRHSLSDYAKAKVVVLVFTCNHCPVAKAYEDRLIAIQKDYAKKGVQLVAVNVNNIPADRLEKMKERAKEKGFNFPYLYDPTQKIARDYGATCTPHVFVLDQNRKIAYMGNIDDNQRHPEKATPNLRNALDAVLAGKKPDPAVTKQFGCSIKWD